MSCPDTFTTTIPTPPSANKIWRSVPGKGVLKSQDYRKWLQATKAVLQAHVWQGVRFGDDLVRVRIIPPFNSRRDLDNYGKATLDALVQSGMLHTDRMTAVPHIEIEAGTKNQDGCIVTISRIQASVGEG